MEKRLINVSRSWFEVLFFGVFFKYCLVRCLMHFCYRFSIPLPFFHPQSQTPCTCFVCLYVGVFFFFLLVIQTMFLRGYFPWRRNFPAMPFARRKRNQCVEALKSRLTLPAIETMNFPPGRTPCRSVNKAHPVPVDAVFSPPLLPRRNYT